MHVYRLASSMSGRNIGVETSALFHEIDEVVGDIIHPVKVLMGEEVHDELDMLRLILSLRFGLTHLDDPIIEIADQELMRLEAHTFFENAARWCPPPCEETCDIVGNFWYLEPEECRDRFHNLAVNLLTEQAATKIAERQHE